MCIVLVQKGNKAVDFIINVIIIVLFAFKWKDEKIFEILTQCL